MKPRFTEDEKKHLIFAFDSSLAFGVTMLVLAAVLFVGYVIEKKQNDIANINTPGAYAIVINWPNGSRDDVDLYVEDPNGNVVFFQAKERGLMHLERDDLGTNDKVVDQKTEQEITVQEREERVILQGILPGEYIVNVHMYTKRDSSPTVVTAKLVELRGAGKVETKQDATLAEKGDERTMFRFTLSPSGEVSNINQLQKKFVDNAKAQATQGGGP